MKKISIIILFLLWAQICLASTPIANQIKQEINTVDPDVNIGIKIKNLKTGKVVYQQNANRYYTFASALKFVTVATLKHYFGDDYRFISKISKINNDYYLSIDDPDFSTADLDSLVKQLKEKEGKNIKGNFYIVKNEFLLPKVNENHMNIDNIYYAPITQVHLNKNRAWVVVSAGANIGDKISVTSKEIMPYKIVNQAVTISDLKNARIYTSINEEEYIIKGNLNKILGEITILVTISDNFNHIKLMLEKLFKKHEINIAGKILSSGNHKAASEIAEVYKTFYQVGSIALKKSDNFITDYLLAKFASNHGLNDWKEAGALLKQYVKQQFNVDLKNSCLADGSGLSRYNLLSVNNFDDFLSAIYHKNNFDDIEAMMASPEGETTLKDRFKGIDLNAKDGGMTGVSSLVGYFYDHKNVPYSFVIVANNYVGDKKKYKSLEEAIIRTVLKSANG